MFGMETAHAGATAIVLPPALSVSLVLFVSPEVAAVALLSNAPALLIFAVTVIEVAGPGGTVATVHGKAVQPEPLTPVIIKFVGESVTCTLVAVVGPVLVRAMV